MEHKYKPHKSIPSHQEPLNLHGIDPFFNLSSAAKILSEGISLKSMSQNQVLQLQSLLGNKALQRMDNSRKNEKKGGDNWRPPVVQGEKEEDFADYVTAKTAANTEWAKKVFDEWGFKWDEVDITTFKSACDSIPYDNKNSLAEACYRFCEDKIPQQFQQGWKFYIASKADTGDPDEPTAKQRESEWVSDGEDE